MKRSDHEEDKEDLRGARLIDEPTMTKRKSVAQNHRKEQHDST